MKVSFKDMPLQVKMITVTLMVNLFVFLVNIALIVGINIMSNRVDSVYRENLYLSDFSESLTNVQDSMTEYLNSKTSDALENYYLCEQDYRDRIDTLTDVISDSSFDRMERNIKNMSETYLEKVGQTIDAKRGRSVEKYRASYEEASELYGYIKTYIYSLNNEQFVTNSANYSVMLNNFKQFEKTSMIVMIMVILGDIIIITRITYALTNPLRELSISAEKVAKGNFDIEPLPVDSKDEIGVVTSTFNQMVTSIRDYIEQIKRSMEVEQELRGKELMMQAHLKDAQLKYLQAQINPHFLFNTLNAGAQLAMMEGADRTYEYVQRMSEFFRYNVKKGTDTVTLEDEIKLIDNYIYILNVRFAGDIHYEKDVDESLTSVTMPSMILQPIVENCVNHGIREMMGEGKISLKVYGDGGTVCVSISDNGVGMTAEKIKSIFDGSVENDLSSDSNGIGMDNVIARLRLFCKEDDCIEILSDGPGMGSEFIIYLDESNEADSGDKEASI